MLDGWHRIWRNLFALVEIQRQLPAVVSFYVAVKQFHALIFLIDLCVNLFRLCIMTRTAITMRILILRLTL